MPKVKKPRRKNQHYMGLLNEANDKLNEIRMNKYRKNEITKISAVEKVKENLLEKKKLENEINELLAERTKLTL